MNIQEINSAIMFGNFTNEQLDSILSAVKFARTEIAKANKRQFRVGSDVKFVSNRNGQLFIGKVEKVGIKNMVVRTGLGLYRVPANMLESA
jgi:hypothetical protein